MKKTYLNAAISIFCWSTVATVCKILLADLNSMQLLWMNSLIAGVFLFIINLATGNFKSYNYKLKDYLAMMLIGIPGTFFYYIFYYSGTDILPASQAFIINYLWPIMSVLFACLILGEKLTVKKIIAIIISFLGVVVVVGDALKDLNINAIMGALFCILGAVSYGLFTALNQKKNYNKSMTLMVSYFATLVLTTIINGVKGDLFLPATSQVAGFLWNAIFAVAIANTCWVNALKSGDTAKVSNLAYITPFLSGIWTYIFLNEKITASSVIGLVIIVLGIFIQLKDKKKA